MPGRVLIVGSRGSALALEQARRVRAGLAGESELKVVHTSGDRFTETPLGQQNSVGFFTKEIEEELLGKKIDVAAHSLKDLPTLVPPGLALAALMVRDDPADVLLVRPDALDASQPFPLKRGGSLGASSKRRQAELLLIRPDIRPQPIRGNVTTRIDKVRRGEHDAILLSMAGLQRLSLDVAPLVAYRMNPRRWPGAPGQSIIAVETRADDTEARERVLPLEHVQTRLRADAERSLLVAYGGGCHEPFGSYCEVREGQAEVFVAAPGQDGAFSVQRFVAGGLEAARQEAEAWIRAGRPTRASHVEEEWLCQPAPPWC